MQNNKPLKTHYQNLQVAENASPEVLKGAYKYLCQKYHPDKATDDDQRDRYQGIIKIINSSYAVLSDPVRREKYDRWLCSKREEFEFVPDEVNIQSDRMSSDRALPDNKNNDSLHGPGKDSFLSKFFGGRHHPWRRYFARMIDFTLAYIVTIWIYEVAFSDHFPASDLEDPFGRNGFFAFIVAGLVLLIFESLSIAKTQTTPGKWILGIRVSSSGAAMSLMASFKRSLLQILYGSFFYIPGISYLFNLYRYKDCSKNGFTPWDHSSGSMVSHSSFTPLRIVILLVLMAAYFVGLSTRSEDNSSYSNAIVGDVLVSNECDNPVVLHVFFYGEGEWQHGSWDIGGHVETILDFGDLFGPSAEPVYYRAEAEGYVWDGTHTYQTGYGEVGVSEVFLGEDGMFSIWLQCEN